MPISWAVPEYESTPEFLVTLIIHVLPPVPALVITADVEYGDMCKSPAVMYVSVEVPTAASAVSRAASSGKHLPAISHSTVPEPDKPVHIGEE